MGKHAMKNDDEGMRSTLSGDTIVQLLFLKKRHAATQL